MTMMLPQRPSLIRPGEFGRIVPADARRGTFDTLNEAIIASTLPVDAVFIGDSITDGWALDAFVRGPTGLVVNRGISGDQTSYLRRRFAADVIQLRPRLVILLMGINNMWALDNLSNSSQWRSPEAILEDILADTQAVIAEARAQGIAIALGSILPTHIPFLAQTSVRNHLIRTVNQHLITLVEGPNEVYLDYHARFVDEDGVTLAPGWSDDGLHPHVYGYRLMTEVLLSHLPITPMPILTARHP